MLNRIVASITRDRQVAGVEVSWQSAHMPAVRGVVLELSQDKVLLKDKWTLENLNQLSGRLSKGMPVALVLNGKGVLHKQVKLDRGGQTVEDTMLETLLPAIKPAEFYVQRYQAESNVFFSLARREKVEALCQQIKEQGANLIALTLGPFVFGGIWPYLQDENQSAAEKVVGDCHLQLEASGITGFRMITAEDNPAETKKSKIGEDELEEKYLLAYGAAFKELVTSSHSLFLQVAPVEASRAEYHYQKIFKLGLTTALTFFLLVLLGNFLLFNHFSGENSTLEQQLNNKRNSLFQLNKLEKETQEKRQFLQATGWLHSSRWSFYADRLAATLPKNVRLIDLAINPIDENLSKAQGHLIIENGLILVRGICSNPMALNEWIKKIAKLNWVERVEKQNYTYEDSKGEGKFDFYIRLKGGH